MVIPFSIAWQGWRLSHLRRLILVTYASSQWRGKKFLIEHVVNVKTLNGSEHDGRSCKRWYGFYAFTGGKHFIFFLLKLKILEAKVKFDAAHTWHNFFWKKSWFLQNFRRERTVLILFLKKMENLRWFFHIYSRTWPCLVPLQCPSYLITIKKCFLGRG